MAGLSIDTLMVIESLLKMKEFVNFGERDVENLKALKPVFEKHGARITDHFYAKLGQFDATKNFLEGRVDHLKQTHKKWMEELFQGEYGEEYFLRRLKIGMAHVRIGLDPTYVEGVMCILRTSCLEAIFQAIPSPSEAMAKYQSLLKILDLDLMAVNLSYSEERLDRMAECTGMSRALIENLIKQSPS